MRKQEELYRVYKNFTRHDKKTCMILLCEMLEYTKCIFGGGIPGGGVFLRDFKEPGEGPHLALRYISDYCYPTVADPACRNIWKAGNGPGVRSPSWSLRRRVSLQGRKYLQSAPESAVPHGRAGQLSMPRFP